MVKKQFVYRLAGLGDRQHGWRHRGQRGLRPRAPAETEIVAERDLKGRPIAAHLIWESLMGTTPSKVLVTFDGEALPVVDVRAALPPTTRLLRMCRAPKSANAIQLAK
ncbi:MAG TPA: hypothetical protein VLO07_05685 [Thermoanaerobaculia bacterium]|nr:hypothetical protein [Thermoanaerobaculia bacterium]